jgi:hypothetical protein
MGCQHSAEEPYGTHHTLMTPPLAVLGQDVGYTVNR